MSDLSYGPPLPPGYKKPTPTVSKSVISETQSDDTFGPVLPPTANKSETNLKFSEEDVEIAPGSKNTRINDSNSSVREKNVDIIGPALPPNFQQSADNSEHLSNEGRSNNSEKQDSEEKRFKDNLGVIGPTLPPGFGPRACNDVDMKSRSEDADSHIRDTISGKSRIPANSSSSDEEDDLVGPSCHMMASKEEMSAKKDVEERSTRMKDRLTGKTDGQSSHKQERESWMTELPTSIGISAGLSARTFKTRPGPVDTDRSGWTETPSDRENKKKDKSKKRKHDSTHFEKDESISKEIKAYNDSKRPTSLLEMHQKERKKSKNKEELPQERRPFDRDTDLQVNRFDDAQRKALIKKSQDLGTRFKSGGTQL